MWKSKHAESSYHKLVISESRYGEYFWCYRENSIVQTCCFLLQNSVTWEIRHKVCSVATIHILTVGNKKYTEPSSSKFQLGSVVNYIYRFSYWKIWLYGKVDIQNLLVPKFNYTNIVFKFQLRIRESDCTGSSCFNFYGSH